MSTVSPFADQVHAAFHRSRGVVDLVGELLVLGRQRGLRLDWQNGICEVRVGPSVPAESVEVAISESVFRAILARIAALCNDYTADSVSPYGGDGVVALQAGATSCYQVAFSNCPGDLWLTLSPRNH